MKGKKNTFLGIICALLAISAAAAFGCKRAGAPEAESGAGTAANTPAAATADTSDPAGGETAASVTRGDDALTVLFVNAGKADAIVLASGAHAWMIDTGEKDSVPQILAALNAMDISRLDAVFLTHTHSDHIGGMTALARCVPVARMYAAEISENKKKGGNKITELSEELGVPLTRLAAGDDVPLTNGLSCEVLGPLVYNADDDNDNSLVLRVRAAGTTLLFTGDMQFAEEDTLLDAGVNLSADVLKVGNHGNPDATSSAFAAAAAPSVAVITTDTSVDADSANPRVIAALATARVYVTEEYDFGVLLHVTQGGMTANGSEERPQPAIKLTITRKDTDAQRVTIRNDGADADVGGCILFSERGGETFRFPDGSRIPAGGSVTIGGAGGGADYSFAGDDKPWNVKKDDAAVLYDRFGNVLSRA